MRRRGGALTAGERRREGVVLRRPELSAEGCLCEAGLGPVSLGPGWGRWRSVMMGCRRDVESRGAGQPEIHVRAAMAFV